MTRSLAKPAAVPVPAAISDRIALPALLLVAAIVRFPGLSERGAWDADQGRDLLVLRSLLVDGAWPLLGPVTSIGGVHHGAAYYYLLAPLAAVSSLDPGAIAWLFAVAGAATAGLTWWLARSIGGAVAGFTAGLLVALSPTAIAASETIWNANLVAPAAALTLAASWHAWSSRDPRWWMLALAGLGLTMQLHVVAAILAVPVLALLAGDVRRTSAGARRGMARSIAGGAAIVVLLFIPLFAHELTTGFGELRSAAAFVTGGGLGGQAGIDPLARFTVPVIRIASWPITGLLVDTPLAASLVSVLVVAAAAWRWQASRGEERIGTRWLVGTLALSALALPSVAPDLARVVRGLPNDQYHAFTDPIVPVLLGLAAGGLTSAVAARPSARWAGRAAGVALLVSFVVLEGLRFPPLRDPDGGWVAASAAAERVSRVAAGGELLVVGLPRFKPADGFVYPLRALGRDVLDETGASGGAAETPTLGGRRVAAHATSGAGALIVICDRLFEPAIGAACGGPAERSVELEQPAFGRLADRFDLSSRTSISVYLPGGAGG